MIIFNLILKLEFRESCFSINDIKRKFIKGLFLDEQLSFFPRFSEEGNSN